MALGGAQKARANAQAIAIAPVLSELWRAGVGTAGGMATVMNARGMRTARGTPWCGRTVGRILARLPHLEVHPLGEHLRDVPPPTPLHRAMDLHYRLFGIQPGVWRLAGGNRDGRLAALILGAVRRRRPFDAESVQRAWGTSIPSCAVG